MGALTSFWYASLGRYTCNADTGDAGDIEHGARGRFRRRGEGYEEKREEQKANEWRSHRGLLVGGDVWLILFGTREVIGRIRQYSPPLTATPLRDKFGP